MNAFHQLSNFLHCFEGTSNNYLLMVAKIDTIHLSNLSSANTFHKHVVFACNEFTIIRNELPITHTLCELKISLSASMATKVVQYLLDSAIPPLEIGEHDTAEIPFQTHPQYHQKRPVQSPINKGNCATLYRIY